MHPAVRTEGMRWVRQGIPTTAAPPALIGLSGERTAARISFDGAGHPNPRRGHRPRRPIWSIRTAWRPSRCSSRPARAANPGAPAPGARRAEPPMQGLARVGFGFRVLHRGAGPSGHGGGRGARPHRRIHRAFGQVVRSTATPHSLDLPIGAVALRAVLAAGLRPVRGDAGRARGAARGAAPIPIDVLDVDADPASARPLSATRFPCCCSPASWSATAAWTPTEVHKALAHHR